MYTYTCVSTGVWICVDERVYVHARLCLGCDAYQVDKQLLLAIIIKDNYSIIIIK